jgi:enoyl-CoA hydratase
MTSTVGYELNDSVATITMDDGKVNVLGPDMQAAINQALDRAEKDSAKAVVIAGNDRVFSGGFDLAVFQSGDGKAALGMLAGGFELSVRCLTFPAPVIMSATGSAIAMGSFLLLSGDHRVGQPKTKCQAIEVAIGMTIPIAAIEIMRMRLTPAAFQRGAALASIYVGDDRRGLAGCDRRKGRRARQRSGGRRRGGEAAHGSPRGDQTEGARVGIAGNPGRNRRLGNGIQPRLGR